MCGRYAASASNADLVEEFDIEQDVTAVPSRSLLVAPQDPPVGHPDFNVAPTKNARVVLSRPDRQLRALSWGLIPSWAKDTKIGLRMINARAETARTTSAFAKAVSTRRCIVPADGWYEWQVSRTALDAKGKPRKQPFFIHRRDGGSAAFAGIYEFWRDPAVTDRDDPRAWVTSFAVLTTAAEAGLDRIHDRQPLVLEPDLFAAWLDASTDAERVDEILGFAAPARFDAYPVTSMVNSSRNNGPHLLEGVAPADLHGVLDPMTGEIIG